MEKRKWLWKRRSSERSPGETDCSGSISSHSERYSDDQEALKTSPSDNAQSPEITSKAEASGEDTNDNIRTLKEKLSAALVNVSAKEDLVKQHAKVAEEAIAGWEKAENEVALLKNKLEASAQQNSTLEDKVSHLDGALKECLRQLRLAREEQELKICEAVENKSRQWESMKLELESQLLELQSKAESVKSEPPVRMDHDLCQKLEFLEKENLALKMELLSQSEELQIREIERDLSTQAAETASKQHLESIKKVAKLEAECWRIKAMACQASSTNDHKSAAASSICAESLVDSQSDCGERLNSVEIDFRKMGGSEPSKSVPSCSDSWASALISELDQFKYEKAVNRNLPTSSAEIDLMDDFLEMERLAAMPNDGSGSQIESGDVTKQFTHAESLLRAELEAMIHQTAELVEKLEKIAAEKAELEEKLEKMDAEKVDLEEKLEKMDAEKVELEEKIEKTEAEKAELEMTLTKSQDSIEASQLQLREATMKLEELQRELNLANKSKQLAESKVNSVEMEAQTMASNINSLKEEVEKERALSTHITVKCQKLEEELWRMKQEVELQQIAKSNAEVKIKQEDLEVASGNLAECQKTIASLGKQLKSLATLEDYLIDTTSIPKFSLAALPIPRTGGESWKLHSIETFPPKRYLNSPITTSKSSDPSISKHEGNMPPSSSSSTSPAMSSNHVNREKNRNGFAKFFSRTKNGIQLEL